jgi:hypothetical protein
MKVCSICNHNDRPAIDKGLVDGQSLRVISGQFAVSRSAVDRHRKHLAPALTLAKQATVVTEATTLLSRVEDVISRCELIAEAATKSRDWMPAVAASRELRSCLELLGRLSGELQSGRQVGIQIIKGRPGKRVTVGSPEWEESFREFLDAMLEDEPLEPRRCN